MGPINTNRDRPDARLPKKPNSIFFAIDDINATDKHASEKEPQHPRRNKQAAGALPCYKVTQPRKEHRGNQRRGTEMRPCWLLGVFRG